MSASNIIVTIFIIIWTMALLKGVPKAIALRSKSKFWRWLRKLYWKGVIVEYRDDILRTISKAKHLKLRDYMYNYLSKSVVAKRVYLNLGYVEFRLQMIAKFEYYQREVEKYKYNSFDKLSPEELEYIDKMESTHDSRLSK